MCPKYLFQFHHGTEYGQVRDCGAGVRQGKELCCIITYIDVWNRFCLIVAYIATGISGFEITRAA